MVRQLKTFRLKISREWEVTTMKSGIYFGTVVWWESGVAMCDSAHDQGLAKYHLVCLA